MYVKRPALLTLAEPFVFRVPTLAGFLFDYLLVPSEGVTI
jgi:hypothetical protein